MSLAGPVLGRRRFLGVLGLGAAVSALPACGADFSEPRRAWRPLRPLRVPEEVRVGAGPVRLTVQRGTTAILPGTRTPTCGVNGSFLGPTLRVRTGQQVRLDVVNTLDEVTTLHWHGMHLPARMDGGPHQPIAPGATWSPRWTVQNPASTQWYHPHTHGQTARQVFSGVAGLIVVDDDHAAALSLPAEYGVDDLPCILQDRTIEDDGSMPFETDASYGQMGTDMLVNGTMGAYVEVSRTVVRFRVLNASNARLYNLGFADDREFTVVAGDQGLLPQAVRLSRLRLGPAERAELVVELEPGEVVRMTTKAGSATIDQGDFDLLEVRVAADARPGAAVPTALGGAAPVVPPAGATVRRFALNGHSAINGKEMDMTRIDEVVPAGAVEVWEVENTYEVHNFHVHGCAFTVIDRDVVPPQPWETGRKDTVHLPEGSTARLAVQFGPDTDPDSPFMYHCHILRHEDLGMMGQFVVVAPGTEDSVCRTIDAPDLAAHDHDHGDHDHDHG
ncbi:multicopper oxidase family protein [Nocardioides sp. J54]|uniref:multicopper oxidase family protein n=1 Tax=Nocardioides sp. J54 TaxID=935866 RepID=UPI0018DB71E6|nr:multicopper oxidase domain-containing protein [Nocardioides sp. J54]